MIDQSSLNNYIDSKKMFLFIVYFIMAPLTLFGTIVQIHSIYESEKYFDCSEILGVFDIDETLLYPLDPAFQKPNVKKHAAIVEAIRNQLSLEHQDLLSNLILTVTFSQLIEKTAPLFINKLQEKNIRLIALTAAMTKRFGDDYLPKARYQELQRNGIDFSTAFPEIKELSLNWMKMCNYSFPIFYSGVLCSNGDYQRQKNASSKGKTLCEFLKSVNWIPKKIIFIDDKLYNLEEMQQALFAFDPTISYLGLHYIGAQFIISPSISEYNMQKKWENLLEKAYQFIEHSEELCSLN